MTKTSTKTLHRQQRISIWKIILVLLVAGISYRQVRSAVQTPEAILVLGGATEREVFAAELAREHPNLLVWISSGSNPEFAKWVFQNAGVDLARLHLDYRAVDTVTNFTTLVDDFQARKIRSVYLVTSDYHMRRARVIAEIILGSHGIDFKPVSVASNQAPESVDKAMRDAARSILWLATGKTGSSLGRLVDTR
jgi:uncharacterized SAM-binding protein YcdF (DUF218 family)